MPKDTGTDGSRFKSGDRVKLDRISEREIMGARTRYVFPPDMDPFIGKIFTVEEIANNGLCLGVYEVVGDGYANSGSNILYLPTQDCSNANAGHSVNLGTIKAQNHDNLDRAIQATAAKHAEIGRRLAALPIKGRMTEIASCETVVVRRDMFPTWVERHADAIMGGHPSTPEAQKFKSELVKQMKGMKFGSNFKESQIVELEYTPSGQEFIFGHAALSHYNKDTQEVHVVVSGHGKKWQMADGQSMDRNFWQDHTDDLKAHCRHGALSQIRLELQ